MRLIARIDASLAVTRPLWLWLGQIALVVLGTHLAADRMDDALGRLFTGLPVPWDDPQTPLVIGQWASVAVELLVTVWAVRALWGTTENRITQPRQWARRVSVHNLVAPLFWAVTSLTGAWSIAMALEDALPAHEVSTWIARLAALIVFGRLGATAIVELVRSPPTPKRRIDGLPWLPVLAIVFGYAFWYGLPIWGWR